MQDKWSKVLLGLMLFMSGCVGLLTWGLYGGMWGGRDSVVLDAGVWAGTLVIWVGTVVMWGMHHRGVKERLLATKEVVDFSRDGILGLDAQGVIQWVNGSGAVLLGWESAKEFRGVLRGQPFQGAVVVDVGMDPFRGSEGATGGGSREGGFKRKDGEVMEVGFACRELSAGGYVVSFRDIRDEKEAIRTAWKSANVDELTGLYNRRYVSRKVEGMVAEDGGAQFTVFFIDLDKFKGVNDTYGHKQGDLLLKEISNRLSGLVREGDVVARLGGDEFLVLIEQPLSEGRVQALAQKMVATLREPMRLGRYPLEVSGSVGVARYPLDGGSFEELSSNADFAMYEAKAKGGPGYCFFDETHKEALKRATQLRDQLSAFLKGGLDANGFRCVMNKAGSGVMSVDGVESEVVVLSAGVEWDHADWGTVKTEELVKYVANAGASETGAGLGELWTDFYLGMVLPRIAEAVAGNTGTRVLLEGLLLSSRLFSVSAKLEGWLLKTGVSGDRLVIRLNGVAGTGTTVVDRGLYGGLKGLGCALMVEGFGRGTRLDDVLGGWVSWAVVDAEWLDKLIFGQPVLLEAVYKSCRECGCSWVVVGSEIARLPRVVEWVCEKSIVVV